MRLGIGGPDDAAIIEHGDHVLRRDHLFTPHIKIDRTGEHGGVFAYHMGNTRSGEFGVFGKGGVFVEIQRITLTQIVGHAAFGPQHQPPFARILRAAELRGLDELRIELGRVIDVVLRDVWLNESKWKAALRCGDCSGDDHGDEHCQQQRSSTQRAGALCWH